MSREQKIECAVASAGELISALEEHGPVTPAQARLLVLAAARAAVSNLESWEVWDAALRIAKELEDENQRRSVR
jgi:hypothetical protein